MAPGQPYTVSVTVRNTGYSSWSRNDTVTLATINAPDNDAAQFNNSLYTIDADSPVKTGADYTWNIKMVAPRWNGNYTIEYRMKNGNTYFGDPLVQHVTVGDAGSSVEFIPQQTVWYPPIGSTSIQRNAWLNVSVTVQNLGREGWSEDDQVRLGTVDYEPNNATLFNPSLLFHMAPFVIVNPGDTCTWKFKLHAPPDPGKYLLEYRMKKGDAWFGKTLSVYITVT